MFQSYLVINSRVSGLDGKGMLWTLEPALDQIRWYGPGPGPIYSDRNFERVGIYETTLMNDWVDYSRPQENGNKAGVRWMELVDDNGTGLLLQSLDGEALSCNPLLAIKRRQRQKTPEISLVR